MIPGDAAGGSAKASTRSAISNAMARIKREFYGKGPSRARTYICDTVVFSVLDDVLTPVERAFKERGRPDLVRRTRLTFQDLMTRTFVEEVEALTGATVLAYHSQVLFDPDMAVEVFVLDRPLDAGARAPDVQSAELAEPGEVGDVDKLPGPAGDESVLAGGRQGGRAAARPGEGQVRSAISNAIVRLLHEYWGKGPLRTKVHLEDQFVFCVFEDVFTTVEKTLARGGETALVREMRLEFHEAVAAELARPVEEHTGRSVLASHSQAVLDPDLLFMFFVLDGPEPA